MKKIYLNAPEVPVFDPAFPLPNISFINHVAEEPSWMAGPVRHHNWCEIIYVKRGKAYYRINHRPYTVTEGDIIIFNEGMIHEVHSDPDTPVERFACGFTDLHMTGRPKNHIISDAISPVIPLSEEKRRISSLFDLILDTVTQPATNAYALCQHAICTILTYIDEIIHELPAEENLSADRSLANEIVAYIDAHYMEPLTLSLLSRHFFISPDYLSHIVKKEYGFSPIEYLLNRRIGESIRLLMSTNFNIKTISEMVGYPNIHHYSTAFKKKVGTSPSFYRKSLIMHSTPQKDDGKML